LLATEIEIDVWPPTGEGGYLGTDLGILNHVNGVRNILLELRELSENLLFAIVHLFPSKLMHNLCSFRFVCLRYRIDCLLQVSAITALEVGEDAERISVALLQPVLQVVPEHGGGVVFAFATSDLRAWEAVVLLEELYPSVDVVELIVWAFLIHQIIV
jgi:hypothetical protein